MQHAFERPDGPLTPEEKYSMNHLDGPRGSIGRTMDTGEPDPEEPNRDSRVQGDESDSPFQFGRDLRQRRIEQAMSYTPDDRGEPEYEPAPPMIATREFAFARRDKARSLAFDLGAAIASHKAWIDASWRHERPEKDRRLARIQTLDARRCRLLALCSTLSQRS